MNHNILFLTLILLSFQDFFSRKTSFYFFQFLSKFLKYLSSNFLLSYPYNIFIIYFSNNSLLLKFLYSTISNFSYLLSSIFNLFSNSTIIFFAFSKSFSLFYILLYVKYIIIMLFFSRTFYNVPVVWGTRTRAAAPRTVVTQSS